jgi:hypothetical protein
LPDNIDIVEAVDRQHATLQPRGQLLTRDEADCRDSGDPYQLHLSRLILAYGSDQSKDDLAEAGDLLDNGVVDGSPSNVSGATAWNPLKPNVDSAPSSHNKRREGCFTLSLAATAR